MTPEYATRHELPEEIAPTIVYDESLERAPYHVFVNAMLAGDIMETAGIPRENLPEITAEILYKPGMRIGWVTNDKRDKTIFLNTFLLPHPERHTKHKIVETTAGVLAHEACHILDKDNKVWTTDRLLRGLTPTAFSLAANLELIALLSKLEWATGALPFVLLMFATGTAVSSLAGHMVYYEALSPLERRARAVAKQVKNTYSFLYALDGGSPSTEDNSNPLNLIHLVPK